MADEALSFEGWEIDFSTWKQKDKTSLLKAEQEALKDGDETRLYPFWVRAVRKWPYASDPAQTDSYGELMLQEYQGVVKRIREKFKSYIA